MRVREARTTHDCRDPPLLAAELLLPLAAHGLAPNGRQCGKTADIDVTRHGLDALGRARAALVAAVTE